MNGVLPCFIMLYFLKSINFKDLLVVHDLAKIRLEGRAAYQAAVDVSLREQIRCGRCIYRSAVLDADRLCGRLVIDLSDAGTDACAYLLRLLCGSGLSGSTAAW